MNTKLKERVLITGGSRGIGASIANRCREDGYEVVILDREGGDAIQCDLADPESTARAVSRAREGGPITRLVNNVGAAFPNPVLDQSLEEFDSAIAVNLRSAFVCTKLLLGDMRTAKFGRVVSIASRAALGKKNRTAYSAAKAGLLGMTGTWALEEAAHGITANVVGPGPIETDLFRSANPGGSPEAQLIRRSVPVGRMGTGEDVANSVSFFLDEKCGFVTGQTMYVCGGMTVGSRS